MGIAIIILLVANLLLGGWIMITLNEVDRTNTRMMVKLNTNLLTEMKAISLIAEKLEITVEDFKKIL
tara:strand:- start:294 stop:494 length:201 start_codon:yes stop_codon:yes gene_type:complete